MTKSIAEILDKRESKKKTVRTKAKEPTKKAKKITKKEQQIIDIANSISLPDNYHLVNTKEALEQLVDKYKDYKKNWTTRPYVFLDTETYGVDSFRDELISISIGFMDNQHYNIPMRPFKHEMSKDIPTLDFDYVADTLRPLLEDDYDLVLANSKYDIHILYNWANIDITYNIAWDTMIAGGLLNENHPKGLKEWYKNYVLPDLVHRGVMSDESHLPTFKFGDMFDKIPFDEVPHNLATYYACHDTFMTKAVFEYQYNIFHNPAFKLDKVYKLFREVEMPLIAVFAEAERRGITIDGDFLKNDIGAALSKKIDDILNGYNDPKTGEYVKGIYDYLGRTIILNKTRQRQKNGIKYKEQYEVEEELNIGSPKQLAYKLYEEHKILEPVMEYDKTQKKKVPKQKTDKKTLNRNVRTHPVIPLILEYRGLSKLVDAFCKTLPEEAKGTIDGKVHPSYNQLVRTGRVSCSSPNLQQIPSKFNLIRYAFRSDEGRLLASIDFSLRKVG